MSDTNTPTDVLLTEDAPMKTSEGFPDLSELTKELTRLTEQVSKLAEAQTRKPTGLIEVRPTRFYGRPDKAPLFMELYEEVSAVNGWSDEDKKRQLRFYLLEKAWGDYKSLWRSYMTRPWDDLKTDFLQHYAELAEKQKVKAKGS